MVFKNIKAAFFLPPNKKWSTTITTDDTLFICPRCGESTLAIHRKTYEKTVIFFCTNCHLSQTYEPSKTAYLDPELSWKEFTTKYKQKITP
jgi:transcription elongation factor Elf1